jgi:hypothetical protein
MKWTKGNWRVADDFSEVTTSPVGVLEGSKCICKISFFDKTTKEVQANARLIATAPEMLELLKQIDESMSIRELDELLIKACDIIKKAEGANG